MSAFIVDTAGRHVRARRPAGQARHVHGEHRHVPDDRSSGAAAKTCSAKKENGFRIAMGNLISGRLSVAAGCLGVIEDCLDRIDRYCKERFQHGKPIGKHQLVQAHLAHIEMARAASDALIERAAHAKQHSDEAPRRRGATGGRGRPARRASEILCSQRRLGSGRSRGANLRRPRLERTLSRRPAPARRPRLPHL
jgi:alkylation response protein AidB-like acyl-CoA dehydrogenase